MREPSGGLAGHCRARAWRLRLRRPTSGGSTSVETGWTWALEREEAQGDVVGFYRTHPGISPVPSARDASTMRAWVSCFGKPLLCAIQGQAGLRAYLFDSGEAQGPPLPRAARRAGGRTVWMEDPADE